MKFTVPNPSLEVEFNDEIVCTGSKAAVMEIKKDGEVLVSVQAMIEREKDSDGVWHSVVKFRRMK